MIQIIVLLYVLVCVGVIVVRSLCVLDHMGPATRLQPQLVYSLKLGGAIGVAFEALMGADLGLGVLALLGALAIACCDSRTFPPRAIVARRRERRDHQGGRGAEG